MIKSNTILNTKNAENLKKQSLPQTTIEEIANDLEIPEIPHLIDQIEYIATLGKGSFGEICRAFDKKIQKMVILKYLYKYNDGCDTIEEIKNEISILQKFNEIKHPNFLKFYGLFLNSNESEENWYRYIEIESWETDLKQILNVRTPYLREEAAYLLKILANDYQILEENGIAHRDVKPDNVVIVRTGNFFDYKISDFGISIIVKKGETMISCQKIWGYTDGYVAPEVIKLVQNMNKKPNKKYDPFLADVYSLGMLILKIMKISKSKFLKQIDENDLFLRILKKMLSDKAKDRPRFSEISKECDNMKIKGPNPSDEENNMMASKKLAENEKSFEQLEETFYRYLDLKMEKEAVLVLEAMESVDNPFKDFLLELKLIIAKGDFSIVFNKDFLQNVEESYPIPSIDLEELSNSVGDRKKEFLAIVFMRRMMLYDMKFLRDLNDDSLLKAEEQIEFVYCLKNKKFYNSEFVYNDAGKNNFAIHLALQKKYAESTQHFLEISKKNIEYYNNLAIVFFISDNLENLAQLIEESKTQFKNESWKQSQDQSHLTIFQKNLLFLTNKKKYDIDRFEFIFLWKSHIYLLT